MKCCIQPPCQHTNHPTPLSIQGGPSDPPNPTPDPPPSTLSCGLMSAIPQLPAATLAPPSGSSMPWTMPSTSIATSPSTTLVHTTAVSTLAQAILPSHGSL